MFLHFNSDHRMSGNRGKGNKSITPLFQENKKTKMSAKFKSNPIIFLIFVLGTLKAFPCILKYMTYFRQISPTMFPFA